MQRRAAATAVGILAAATLLPMSPAAAETFVFRAESTESTANAATGLTMTGAIAAGARVGNEVSDGFWAEEGGLTCAVAQRLGGGAQDAEGQLDAMSSFLLEARGMTPCLRGMAGPFPCNRVNLHAYLPIDDIGGTRGSDVWGWTDPENNRKYALAGRENGTAVVDVTNPTKPLYLANLPTSSSQDVIWRDIKTHADHMYVVSEARGHGMQVYDLTQLRDLDPAQAPHEITEDFLYTDFGRSHNIFINEDSGYAYAIGNREDIHACRSGLHMIDLSDPGEPVFAGCYAEDGYTHDTQCVMYEGPDERYHGREICFSSNENTVTLTDVTDKSNPVMLSRTPYDQVAYTHQGWLTEDQAVFLMNDELDEIRFGHNTRTYMWDMSDLEDPQLLGRHEAETTATTHNAYVVGDRVYQANYRAGLQVLDVSRAAEGELTEVASFDTYPPDGDSGFSHGSWSNYPFFDNGTVLVHGYEGLFILRPTR